MDNNIVVREVLLLKDADSKKPLELSEISKFSKSHNHMSENSVYLPLESKFLISVDADSSEPSFVSSLVSTQYQGDFRILLPRILEKKSSAINIIRVVDEILCASRSENFQHAIRQSLPALYRLTALIPLDQKEVLNCFLLLKIRNSL